MPDIDSSAATDAVISGGPFSLAKGGNNGPCIRVVVRDGVAGIELYPDGTSKTFGDYNPDETAKEFFRLVAHAYKLNSPQGSA